MQISSVLILEADCLPLNLVTKWTCPIAYLGSWTFAVLVVSAADIACSVARFVDP